MNVLVLGSRGQLARHLRELLEGARFWGRREANMEDPAGLEAAILKAAPAAIINAAAYTAVEKAEDEPAVAWRVNAEGAAAAARAAAALNIPLIQVSTDYVFDGDRETPYRELDPTHPINVYGKTKLAGELAVASLTPRHWILRTSWVFSEFDGNFVTTMLRLANERNSLRVVADQRGRPTYAGDLARVIAALVTGQTRETLPWGIHHVSGGEGTSWHQFAEWIVARAHDEGLVSQRPAVDAITTADYPTRARRPMNSILEPSQALQRAVRVELDWRAGLDEVLTRLSKSGIQSDPPQVMREPALRGNEMPGTDLSDSAEALSLQTVGLHQQLRNIRRDARIRHARRLHPLRIVLGDPMVTVHSGGIIVRGKALRSSRATPLLYRGGAYTSEKEIVTHSRTVRTAESRCIVGDTPDLPPRPVRKVSKRVLYGGFVFEHFGHLLLEGLSRLWGARLTDNRLPIYVQCAGANLSQAALTLLDLAGLAKRVHVVRQDTSFDSVVVPEPAFVIQSKAHKAFKEMYLRITDRVLGSSHIDTTDQPLYLSRTGLPPNVRALFGESLLEDVLRRNGAHIVHPERLDLTEQIRLINRHRVVLGPIGTAFHLLLFSRLANEATYFCTDSPNLSYGLCDVLNGTRAQYLCVAARRPPFHHGRFKRAAAYPEILNIDVCLAYLRDQGYIANLEYDRRQLASLEQEHRRRFLHAALRDAQTHRNRALLDATAEVVRRDYRNDATLVRRLETVVEILSNTGR